MLGDDVEEPSVTIAATSDDGTNRIKRIILFTN